MPPLPSMPFSAPVRSSATAQPDELPRDQDVPRDRKIVYVIDDEKSVAGMIEAFLLEEGYEVFVSYSGEEALEELDSQQLAVDLFIVDIVLPGLSGPDLAVQLRQRSADAKILFTSGHGEGAGRALRQANPDAHFLAKPFELAEAVEVIQAVLDSSE